MAVFRSLKALIQNPKKSSRTFLTATASSSSISAPLHYSPLSYPLSYPLFRLPSQISRTFLSPLTNWIVPFHGPLFLSRPPWKLSQSSTPLYLGGNGIVLRKIEASLQLNLLRRKPSFSLPLEVGSLSPAPTVVDRGVGLKDVSDDFVNLPNMISMSRLISGPLLGWMITNEWYSSAMVGLAISGASDWLDGYMARRMKINSVVGSYLDPLADKVLIGCVALALVHKGLIHHVRWETSLPLELIAFDFGILKPDWLDSLCSGMLALLVVQFIKELVAWRGSGIVGPTFSTLMEPVPRRSNHSLLVSLTRSSSRF